MYVMLTVTVDCDGSGKSSTSSPFESRYSVMPASSRTLVAVAAGGMIARAGAAGAIAGDGGGAGGGIAGAVRDAPPHAAAAASARTRAPVVRVVRMQAPRLREIGATLACAPFARSRPRSPRLRC